MKFLNLVISISLFGLIGLLSSCEEIILEEFAPSPTDSFLIGKWQEKEPEDIGQFVGTNHCIEFTIDNFLLKQRFWTDAIDLDNPCNNGFTIFYKGVSTLTETQLSLNGQHTNEDFELSAPDCNRAALFLETFDYIRESENVIILNPNEAIFLQIRLERQ